MILLFLIDIQYYVQKDIFQRQSRRVFSGIHAVQYNTSHDGVCRNSGQGYLCDYRFRDLDIRKENG